MTFTTAAAAFVSFIGDAMAVAVGNNNSPWTTLMIAILVGSAVHLVISLLVTLKHVGMHVYLVVQLMGVWYLIPHTLRLELCEQAKSQAAFLSSSAALVVDALARMTTNSTAPQTL